MLYDARLTRFAGDLLSEFYPCRDLSPSWSRLGRPDNAMIEDIGRMTWNFVKDKWFGKWPVPNPLGDDEPYLTQKASWTRWGTMWLQRPDVQRHYYENGGRRHFHGPYDVAFNTFAALKWSRVMNAHVRRILANRAS